MGNGDYAVTKEEALNGIVDLSQRVDDFLPEFNYYWRFFNGFAGDWEGTMYNMDPNDHPDECLYLGELQSTMAASYDVTTHEIREYWQNWYYVTYGITSFYFDIYYLGNGEFKWDDD